MKLMDVVSIGETMILFTPNTYGPMRYAYQFSKKFAGAETNTLIGLAKLGHQTGWISKVGNDEFGSSILASVRGEGVDISQVYQSKDAPTGIFFKEQINENNVRIYYYRKNSAVSTLTPDDINENYLANSKYLYLTGITPALSDSCRKTVFRAIEVARKEGVKVVFDPNLRRKLWDETTARKTLLSIAEMSDIVLPGITEGEFLFGENDPQLIADSFKELGSDIVVVKLGEKGAYYSTQIESGEVPAFSISNVVDPVGAGDGFAAGFLSGLLDNLPLYEAVVRACAVGAIVTTVNGDIEGLPDRNSLQIFMNPSQTDDVIR